MSGERRGLRHRKGPGHEHEESRAGALVELGTAIATLALGALALVAGTFDGLWNWLGVAANDHELRGLLSVGVSVFILLAGFLILVWQQNDRTQRRVSRDVDAIVARVREHAPSFAAAEIVSKEEAFKELDRALQDARCAWNTRLGTGHEPTRYSTTAAQRYAKRIGTELGRGLIFKDVAAATFEDQALELRTKVGKGKYECWLFDVTGPGYINFIVLELNDGSHLTFAGWSATIAHGDKSVLRFRDDTVARFFTQWHDGLVADSDRKVK